MSKQSQKSTIKKTVHYDDPQYNYLEYWDGRDYEHLAEQMAIKRLLEGKHFRNAVDVGGGYGRLSVLLKKYADTVTLAEPSSKQLIVADKFLQEHPDINRLQMAASDLQFSNGSVDLVTIIRVMHHLPDPSAELQEISRVLSSDGYAIIEIANFMHARNRLRHLIRHKRLPTRAVSIASPAHADDETPFVNHNPHQIIRQLAHAGLRVERILSVSNLRSSGLKKLMPKRVMLAIEGILQPTLAHSYFGPSIFFLVRKVKA